MHAHPAGLETRGGIITRHYGVTRSNGRRYKITERPATCYSPVESTREGRVSWMHCYRSGSFESGKRIVANRDWRGIFHCEIVILSFVQIIVSINHPTSLSNFFFHLCCNIGKIGEMKFCIKIGTNSCKIMFRCSWNLKIEKFF